MPRRAQKSTAPKKLLKKGSWCPYAPSAVCRFAGVRMRHWTGRHKPATSTHATTGQAAVWPSKFARGQGPESIRAARDREAAGASSTTAASGPARNPKRLATRCQAMALEATRSLPDLHVHCLDLQAALQVMPRGSGAMAAAKAAASARTRQPCPGTNANDHQWLGTRKPSTARPLGCSAQRRGCEARMELVRS